MNDVIIDDIYVYTFFDKADNAISTGVVKSIEELQTVSENNNVILMSYFNITGRDIKIGEPKIMGKLELQTEGTVE